MSVQVCPFFWYELLTTDTKAAIDFYGEVIGWTPQAPCVEGEDYTVLTVDGYGVAGAMVMPEDYAKNGGRPAWTGYIWVPDVDEYVEKVLAAGGKLCRPAMDIPGIGRFAPVTDPHGAIFLLMTPQGEAPPNKPSECTPGMPGWSELHAGNGPEAWEFYSSLFGWEKQHAMDMGEHGVYQIFSSGGNPSGAVMTKMPDTPHPFWVFYFHVDEINAAIERVKAKGGQIVMGPHEVPGNSWIAQGIDPQGAFFAMVAGPIPTEG